MSSPDASPTPKQILRHRLSVVAAILVIGLFWMLTKWLAAQAAFEADPGEAARSEFRIKTLDALRAEEKTKLETFAWVDRANGSVQIPIDLAIKLVLPELRANKPKPAYPIATPSARSSRSAGMREILLRKSAT